MVRDMFRHLNNPVIFSPHHARPRAECSPLLESSHREALRVAIRNTMCAGLHQGSIHAVRFTHTFASMLKIQMVTSMRA